MATSSRLNLTRDQLASFLQDHEQIKQFERLFANVSQLEPTTLADLAINASNAGQQAVEALDAVAQLAQNTAFQADAKAQQALDLIAQLTPLVDLLATSPPPREFKRSRYGSFYDTTTQTAAAINTAYAMTFNTTDLSRGVYIGSPTSRIYVDESSLYDLQFSAQLDNTSGGNHLAYIWLRINGVDVTNSASQVRLKGTDGELVAAWNFFADLKAGDYFELMWSVNDTAVQLTAQAAASPVPGIPSIILTVSNNILGVQ